jgi:hypothetical protein
MRFVRSSRLLRIALAILLLLPSAANVAAQASPTPAPLSYDQARQALDRLLLETQRVREQLDASQFDLDALSAKLGVKADDIVNYVRDNIAFEQYPGLLRGPKWTLIGRAGNSIDQAALLATLLTKAGYQIKIEHGTLNPEQATLLLLQMQVPRKPAPALGNLDALKTLMKQMAKTAGISDSELQPYLDGLGQPETIPESDASKLDADAAGITAALNLASVKLGDPSNLASLATEASDYFWVSYRKSVDDDWTDAHPAFKDGSEAPMVTPIESFSSVATIPAADQQTIKIEPIIERSVDGVISQKPLAPPIEGNAADLAGQPIFFTTLSNAAAVVDSASVDINDVLTKANLFMVQFNNHTIDNTSIVFDNHGSLFTLKQLKPGEFGLQPQTGEVVSEALNDAIAAINGDPTPTPGPAPDLELTGVWINFSFTVPGGQTTTVRRTIVDRIGEANRAAGSTKIANSDDRAEVAAQLSQNISMFASVGQSSVSYLTDQFLQRIATIAPLLRIQLQLKYSPNSDASLSNEDRDAIGTAWPGFPQLMSTFDAIATVDPTVVSYRPAPAFVTYRQEVVNSGDAANAWQLVLSVDVVANPRRDYSIADGSLALSPEDGVRAGVWETHSETVPDVDEAKAVTYNTMTVMAAAKSQHIHTKVVKSTADLTGIEMSPDGLKHLSDDLAAGYVAIVPVKTPNGQPMNGWWRVNPKTGVTLGMLENGRGTAMSETGMLIRAIACAAAFAFAGQGVVSMLIGCGFGIGGAAAGYAGASALVGEIIGMVGLALGLIASAYGV